MRRKDSRATHLDEYESRKNEVLSRHDRPSLLGNNPVGWVITFFFLAVDCVTLYSLWNTILTMDPVMCWFIVAANAAVFDLPLSIAGNGCREAADGLRTRRSATLHLVLALTAFLAVFVTNFILRMSIRDITFASLLEEESGTREAVTGAAVVMGILPAATSVLSFMANFMLNTPSLVKLERLESCIIDTEAHITEMEEGLAEAGDSYTGSSEVEETARSMRAAEQWRQSLHKQDHNREEKFREQVETLGLSLEEYAITMLAEYLADPDSLSTLTEHGANLLRKVQESNEPELQSHHKTEIK